jgi:hypothetical protein
VFPRRKKRSNPRPVHRVFMKFGVVNDDSGNWQAVEKPCKPARAMVRVAD